MMHTISKGPYPLERLELREGWLLAARPMLDHPDFLALSTYVVPILGIAVTRWTHRPESAFTWYDYYVDILTCERGPTCWTTKDLYLDVVVVEGGCALTCDTDEYLEARREGLLTPEEADFARMKMHGLLNGLGECGYSMKAWVRREVGLEMTF